VFENPHLGADFVPFMNNTTLFSVTHLSICNFSSGPRFAYVIFVVLVGFLPILENDVVAPLARRVAHEEEEGETAVLNDKSVDVLAIVE
jgi:hypothetical protein